MIAKPGNRSNVKIYYTIDLKEDIERVFKAYLYPTKSHQKMKINNVLVYVSILSDIPTLSVTLSCKSIHSC